MRILRFQTLSSKHDNGGPRFFSFKMRGLPSLNNHQKSKMEMEWKLFV